MEDIVLFQNTYYIKADASPMDERTHVLKQGDTFAVLDSRGNINPLGIEKHGIFYTSTRFLSKLVLELQGLHPLLLSSRIREGNDLLAVDLTNPPMTCPDGTFIPQDTVHIQRSSFVWDGCYYERIAVSSYLPRAVYLPLNFHFGADFADIFEVRGTSRMHRGTYEKARLENDNLVFCYTGFDDIVRQTTVTFYPQPCSAGTKTDYILELKPHQTTELCLSIGYSLSERAALCIDRHWALSHLKEQTSEINKKRCIIETSNEQFNDWLNASWADLLMLVTNTPYGLFPYAGVPWFSTPFGRDGIITALQMLWVLPDIARGVLGFLAHYQADCHDPARDAEPGKIMHEKRQGEMANTGEIPFKLYYGSIDTTPLYIVLAGYYLQRTWDLEYVHSLWHTVQSALEWIDTYGDLDGDGFIEYARKCEAGLSNQGWKDSDDAVFHADGTSAPPPIALCEVQGYVYQAKLQAAYMAEALGCQEMAYELKCQADELRQRFHQQFWCQDIGMYALALDRNKRPCRIRSSNAGHCLFSGIADKRHARSTADQLMNNTFFSGWGVRTIASSEVRYNPMSYHNGSVWPHDNALIATGLANYGFKREAVRILTGLFDTSLFMNLSRLPELFCGFDRLPKEGPTRYPVACMPQAWASGSLFQVLQACLGLNIDSRNALVSFDRPMLPQSLQKVELKGLSLPSGIADISFIRQGYDVVVNVQKKRGDFEVMIRK
jgi:glycogen debranching enzyme